MNDQKIVNLLRTNRQKKAFTALYKSFPKIEKLILSKGGSKEDAQDIFQEALVILLRKIQQADFVLTASLDTFLYSICRYLWKNESRKAKGHFFEDFDADGIASEALEIEELNKEENQYRLAEKALKSLGKKCLQILQMFYHQSMSIKQIRQKLGYKSENVVKVQKYKCMEHAKKNYKALSV